MTEATLSIVRSLGALSGLSSTIIFPALHKALGLRLSGVLGISWQLSCLLCGVLPTMLHQLHVLQMSGTGLLYVLLAGVVASRVGLWLFDLTISQLQQESVAKHELGR